MAKRRKRDFFKSFRPKTKENKEVDEIDLYLQEDVSTSVDAINKFTIIKNMFFRYNTVLPSSASVERLFSRGGQIFKPTRSRLSDKNFEALVFLSANSLDDN